MKRTINFKGLLALSGIITMLITMPVILYLIGRWVPDTFKITESSSLYKTVIGDFFDGFGLLLLIVIVFISTGLVIYGSYRLFNWIFPKNISPDKPKRDGE